MLFCHCFTSLALTVLSLAISWKNLRQPIRLLYADNRDSTERIPRLASNLYKSRHPLRFATLCVNETIQLLTKLGWTKQLNVMEDYGAIDHTGCIGTSTLFYSGLVVKRVPQMRYY